jgi:hypothetical protein
MVTAFDIATPLWNKVIKLLIEGGWKVKYKYDAFDAGIDFDHVILEKDNEEVSFGWDNWDEGEISCSEQQMAMIEELIGLKFHKRRPHGKTTGDPGF